MANNYLILNKQEQRSGLPYAAGKSILEFSKELEDLNSLSFYDVLQPYIKSLKNLTIIIRPFERNLLFASDVVHDFLHHTNIPQDKFVFHSELNSSRDDCSSVLASVMWDITNQISDIFEISGAVPDKKWNKVLKVIRASSRRASNLFDLNWRS